LNFKYFDFPIYVDKTSDIEKILETKESVFRVFLHKSDWNPPNEELLYKILHALKLNIEKDVQILVLEQGQNAHISSNISNTEGQKFLAFGLNANRIGLQIKTLPYKVISIKNFKILFSHKLEDLQKNVNYKKLLWAQLQNL